MRYLTILFLVYSFSGIYAQKSESKAGPIIKEFGKVYEIQNPDLNLQKDKEYRVIFDIYTDSNKDDALNPLINTVARYLNMHGQNGISAKNMKVAFVMHGAAAKNALSDKAFRAKFNTDNPNTKLIAALKDANVDIFVCGQSFQSRGFERTGLSKNVKMSLSALTALVEYQENGYKIINFN